MYLCALLILYFTIHIVILFVLCYAFMFFRVEERHLSLLNLGREILPISITTKET
ncbi:hypothetical protein ACJX0J_030813, partial [Zea mays]